MHMIDDKGGEPVIIDDVNENDAENLVVNVDASQKHLVVEKEVKSDIGKEKRSHHY